MSKNDKIFLSLLLLLSVCTFFRWISFNTFTYGDWWYYFPEGLRSIFRPSIWNSFFNFGSIDLTFWRYPVINFPFGILANMGFGQEIAEKLTIFWPTIIIGNLSIYYYIKRIYSSSLAGFIGSIIFNYNSYFLGTTHFLIYSASVWSVFSLLLYSIGLKTNKYFFVILASLSLSVSTAFDLRIAYITFFMLFIYTMVTLVYSKNSISNEQKCINIGLSMLMVILYVLFNAYWLLPVSLTKSLTNNPILNRTLFGNAFLNLKYSIALYYPFWNGTKTISFITQSIPVYYWFVPITAIIGLFRNKQNKTIIFIGIITCLGLLLSKQTGEPFRQLYQFLFNKVPGFNAFREGTKFYFLIALGYSALIGGYAASIRDIKFKSRLNIFVSWIPILLVVTVLLLTVKPIINGAAGSMYISRNIPNDYQILRKFITKDNSYFRTLWVPVVSRFGISTLNNPAISYIEYLSDYSLNNPSLKDRLSMSSIKYIVVPVQDISNDDDFFKNYDKRENYIANLDRVSFLMKRNIETKTLKLYENRSYCSHIYIIDREYPFSNACKNVDFNTSNNSQYEVIFQAVSKPFFLNFSETYNPNWLIRVGNFDWLSVLLYPNYHLPLKYHSKTSFGLNSFYIDPAAICSVEKCRIRSNGSYDIKLTVYFRPQSYMYLGLVISLITLLGCVLTLPMHLIYSKKGLQ